MSNPLRKLPVAAAIYVTGDVLIKAAGFFLLPLMTRYLSPEDYGVLASVTAFVAVLSLVLQMNVNGALMRFYPDASDDDARNELVGTLVLFSLAWSLVVVFGINFAGGRLLDGLYKGVRFQPYLRLATWIAFVNTLTTLPLCLLQMQQRPVMHRVLSLTAFLLNTTFVLLLVVGMRMGALGGVIGQLAGATAASIPFLLLLRKNMRAVWRFRLLKTCLAFCLPLAGYALGGWVTDMSNRVFIERFVNLGELGLFNVGNQFAMILGFVLGATGLAFTPIFYETVKVDEGPRLLARFGVIYVAVAVGIGLSIAVLSREALQILTQPRYHAAYRVIPLLTATQALTSFWHLAVNPLMLKRKTVHLTALMIISAAISVGLNLYLIPRYGILGAAASPLLANIFLNGAVFLFSIQLYPVPYNYMHFALVIVLALLIFFAAATVTAGNVVVLFGVRALILGLYPALLLAFGVIQTSDVRRILENL
jgi:O-antigen/teichoic acid export membrane protein